jgi:hypothetical protein
MHDILLPNTTINAAQSTLSARVNVADDFGSFLGVFQPLWLQRFRCAGAVLFCLAHDIEIGHRSEEGRFVFYATICFQIRTPGGET